MRFSYLLPVLLLVGYVAPAVQAEVAFEKREDATHVVVGRILDIQSESENFGPGSRKRFFVVRLQVAKCESGEGIKNGEVIHVRCEAVTKTPQKFFAGKYGHRYDTGNEEEFVPYVPAKNQKVRFWIKGRDDDGAYRMLYPYGVFVYPPQQ